VGFNVRWRFSETDIGKELGCILEVWVLVADVGEAVNSDFRHLKIWSSFPLLWDEETGRLGRILELIRESEASSLAANSILWAVGVSVCTCSCSYNVEAMSSKGVTHNPA
jgi:hypothetical protein